MYDCKDCGWAGEDCVIVLLTDDFNAFKDGEVEYICPECGGNWVTEQPEDDWREDR